jgi:hypothetical protein
LKRNNITGDKASWNGWYTHARTTTQEFVVLVLRRRFIPPLMDSAVDITVHAHGPVLCRILPVVMKAADSAFSNT